MTELPSGTVTLLFTDIEGSTRLLDELGDRYGEVLAEHRRLLRKAFAAHNGVEVDTQGDAFFFAFARAHDAINAAAQAQQALADGPVQVRMGIHTGEPRLTGEGYVGLDVHRGARIAAAGHGGQVVLSQVTRELLDEQFELRDLGEHRLKDLAEPEWLYQLGEEEFPPLKSLNNTNLPRPASSFVGRERELLEVLSLLRSDARMITLTGAGGSGKTRLAIEAAAEVVGDYPNGVYWIALAPLRDPALVLETVAQTVGAKEELAAHFAGKHTLLLLDNFEQVVEAARPLSELLSACPGLDCVVTSRELLRVTGEQEYAVPPLADPEAVELFCERSGLEPSDQIAELCQRLDKLPLALELAAARTNVLSPAQILERVSSRLDLLKGGRDAEARHQTLRATIEWSYELLSEEDQRLLARLSVFVGGCTLEAAEEVCEAELDTLSSLVDKSLLRKTDERFWMLETIREFAAERLESFGEVTRLRRREAEWVIALVREIARGLRYLEPDALQRMQPEHDNVRAALAWSVGEGDARVGAELVGRLCVYWVAAGLTSEGVAVARRVLASAPSLPRREQIAAIVGASEVLRFTGQLEEAAELNERVLTLLDSSEAEEFPILFGQTGSEVEISTLKDLGSMYAGLGDLERARARCDAALARADELGDDRLVALSQGVKAEIEFVDGQFAEAKELYAATLATWRSSESLGEMALTHLMLGECARRQGDLRGAVDEFRRALRVARTSGALNIRPEAFQEVAAVAWLQGRPELSARLLGASERLREATGLALWDPADFERTVNAVRHDLGTERFEGAWGAGRALTDEQAFDLALSLD